MSILVDAKVILGGCKGHRARQPLAFLGFGSVKRASAQVWIAYP